MALTRSQKDAVIAEGLEAARQASIVVLTGFRGIDVATDTRLRKAVRETGASYQVIKNTLAKRILGEDCYKGLHPQMKGETAYVFGGKDPVAVVKVLSEFAKDNEEHLQIKAGFFEGTVLSSSDLKALADIPPRPVLLSRLAGVLVAPLQRLVNVLQAPLSQTVGVLGAVADKRGKAEPQA